MNTNLSFSPELWANVGIDVETAIERIAASGKDITSGYDNWLRLGFAIADARGEAGRTMFHRLSSMNAQYNEAECNHQYDACMKDGGRPGGVTVATLFQMAKDAGIDISAKDNGVSPENGGKSSSLSSPSSPGFSADDDGDELPPRVFPEEVYEGLPKILQRIVDLRVNDADGTMLLTTSLCALSSLMTRKIFFRYSKRYRPNFLTFVIGTPASGKGRASLSEVILRNINDKLYARSMQARKKYENDRLVWQKSDKKTAGNPPTEPRMELLLLPVNSTCASLDWLLGDNEGCGFMSTSDGGEMAAAWAGDYGNYAVDMLKTVENEPIPRSRKTEKEVVSVPEARFSAVIASTWEQVRKLFGNGRDGLFSRPLFVRMPTDIEWKNQWKEDGAFTDEEICKQIGADVLALFIQLENLGDEKEFELGPQKKKEMNNFFRRKQRELCRVYGPDLAPSIRRMAVTAQRMMCVLSVCREMYDTNGNPSPGPFYCSDEDFKRVITMVDILLSHTATQFCYMPKEDKSSEHFKSINRICFFSALGNEFDRKQSLVVAGDMDISENRHDKYIRYFVDNKMIERTGVGKYKKTAG